MPEEAGEDGAVWTGSMEAHIPHMAALQLELVEHRTGTLA